MIWIANWFLGLGVALPSGGGEDDRPVAWNARCVEHLLNRAAFGASAEELASALELGPEGLVEALVAHGPWIEEPFYGRIRVDEELRKAWKGLPEEEREGRMRAMRKEDREQLGDFLDWWVGRMLAGEDPLRERMTLFWHGHFTSSIEVVRSSYEMIRQNQLLRRHALGSFRELLHGIARDPAMLVYLDNVTSKKENPNENFARELLELFTLGEGHYAEDDVREVARAFTGWGERGGRFRMDSGRHDTGQKRVLGVEGNLDGDDVLDILLEQPACAEHLARELLVYFEGVAPDRQRVQRYARLLRRHEYRFDAVLRELFLDPAFYRKEVVGARVASPLDYLVGAARRLGQEPPGRLVSASAALLGERLLAPPSVKGWEGGRSWITSGTLMQRGNLAGALLGRVKLKQVLGELPQQGIELDEATSVQAGEASMQMSDEQGRPEKRRTKLPDEFAELRQSSWRPALNLTQRLARAGARSEAEMAGTLLSELLAIPVQEELQGRLQGRLEEERAALGLEPGELLDRPELCEPLLRGLAHEILSLPEAQLN